MFSRRDFLKTVGTVATASGALGVAPSRAKASEAPFPLDKAMGVLVDIPRCIGCRRCEYACQDTAGFEPEPIEKFDDKSVFEEQRRPNPRSHTVINRYENPADPGKPVYNKFNCLHCNDPACYSACLVTAFSKREDGPVVYNPSRCMGCRYCMVACPFEIPTYDYDNPITPQVRKCNLCAQVVPGEQEVPSCVKMCPEEVMTYGKREELLALAREKIRRQPDVYIDHIYGEHEVGGTSWLYISNVPFEKVGFEQFTLAAAPRQTERVQHAQFKYFVPPLLWAGVLGAAMWVTRPERREAAAEAERERLAQHGDGHGGNGRKEGDDRGGAPAEGKDGRPDVTSTAQETRS